MTMNKENSKKEFVKFFLLSAETACLNKEAAEEFLKEEGIDTEKLVSEGLKQIKQMQLQINARKTEREMEAVRQMSEKATEWVNELLNSKRLSLKELVEQEELTMSFRNLEVMSQDDLKAILIKHFSLKFFNEKEQRR